MYKKLKPCPFCGTEEPFMYGGDNDQREFVVGVECDGCGMTFKFPPLMSFSEATELWNKRVDTKEEKANEG